MQDEQAIREMVGQWVVKRDANFVAPEGESKVSRG